MEESTVAKDRPPPFSPSPEIQHRPLLSDRKINILYLPSLRPVGHPQSVRFPFPFQPVQFPFLSQPSNSDPNLPTPVPLFQPLSYLSGAFGTLGRYHSRLYSRLQAACSYSSWVLPPSIPVPTVCFFILFPSIGFSLLFQPGCFLVLFPSESCLFLSQLDAPPITFPLSLYASSYYSHL